MKKLLLLLTVSISIGLTAQTTVYVNTNVSGGNNDGSSWTNAYNNLQDALTVATNSDEIWVAAGTYKPGSNETDSFTIPGNVTVLGGFNATETTASERNWAENPTILSGDIDNSNTANAGDSHSIVKMNQNNITIDGFIIQFAYADGTENSPTAIGRTGAGIYNSGNNAVLNCIFHQNNAQGDSTNGIGGAIISFSGAVNVINSLFFNNTASAHGGAISIENGTVNIINCTLANNEANNGGGIHFFNGNMTATNSIFTNNSGTNGNINDGSGAGTGQVAYSLCYNSTTGNNGEIPPNITDGGYNIAASTGSGDTGTDPQYNSINNSNGYRIKPDSPARDAGDNSANTQPFDLDYQQRITDGDFNNTAIIDMGAFEILPLFTDISTVLTGVDSSSVAWGDYDNDGDLDILLTGDTGSEYVSKIYRNDAGTFTDIGAGLIGVYNSSVEWGDYDNDGDLDILLTGNTGSEKISKIYRNDDGTFTDIVAGLTSVSLSAVAWGDYDNDGDLDILLTGDTGSEKISKIYTNNGNGSFTELATTVLTGVSDSSVAWGDYDNDGDLDILLAGISSSGRVSKIYTNNGNGSFEEFTTAGLPGVSEASVAWGDYDNDGDLDVIISGRLSSASNSQYSEIFNNENGSFTSINAGITGVSSSSVAWGDYDNDGDLDILLTGKINGSSEIISKVYQNNAGTFTDIEAGLTEMGFGSIAWGDYDNDGDLDILFTGYSNGGFISKIYRNNSDITNTNPIAPTNPMATVNPNNSVSLSWDATTDSETASTGLSYNVYIKENPVGSPLYAKSPMAQENDGWRKLPAMGNAGQNTAYTWNIPTPYQNTNTDFLFKVQAIDNAFSGSPFSEAATFSLNSLNLNDVSKNTFSIYPNPVNNRLHIKTNSEQYNYVIYTIQGQEILKANNQRSRSIELSKLPSGVYLLELSCNNKLESFKLIIQ